MLWVTDGLNELKSESKMWHRENSSDLSPVCASHGLVGRRISKQWRPREHTRRGSAVKIKNKNKCALGISRSFFMILRSGTLRDREPEEGVFKITRHTDVTTWLCTENRVAWSDAGVGYYHRKPNWEREVRGLFFLLSILIMFFSRVSICLALTHLISVLC